jgi:transposase InsO family protein
MGEDIEKFVQTCPECCKHRSNPVEPLIPMATPAGPWQCLAADLFEFWSSSYLLVVDYYSKYTEVMSLDQTTAAAIITKMKNILARHGIPLTVVTDNGPQFRAKSFADFALQYGFTHITSSPEYPQSNGEAERAVRTIKEMWKKEQDKNLALLAYRTALLESGSSPAELLMSRQLRSRVPASANVLQPRWSPPGFQAASKNLKARQKRNYDNRHRARPLPPLLPGQKVWIDKHITETVVSAAATPRSHIIQTPGGRIRRNRRALRPI